MYPLFPLQNICQSESAKNSDFAAYKTATLVEGEPKQLGHGTDWQQVKGIHFNFCWSHSSLPCPYQLFNSFISKFTVWQESFLEVRQHLESEADLSSSSGTEFYNDLWAASAFTVLPEAMLKHDQVLFLFTFTSADKIIFWDRTTFKDRLCGLVVRVSGCRYRGLGFDSRRYQIFWVVVGLERGPLSLVRSTEELLE